MRVTIRCAEPQRIVVALSGGVDSSVALHLLKETLRTTQLIGLFMNNWDPADEIPFDENNYNTQNTENYGETCSPASDTRSHRTTRCCVQSEIDSDDARWVCQKLNVPYHRVSFTAEYWTDVFQPYVDAIERRAAMPNPDVLCNRRIKFGVMKKYAETRFGADYIATGHYARLWHRSNGIGDRCSDFAASWCDYFQSGEGSLESEIWRNLSADRENIDWIQSWGQRRGCEGGTGISYFPLLLAGADRSKDQSYFLSMVPGDALRKIIFPIGHLIKHPRTAPTCPGVTRDQHWVKGGQIIKHEQEAHDATCDGKPPLSVREIAMSVGLINAQKKESMGICFVGKRNFPEFISEYLSDPTPGEFVCVDTGQIVGVHNGSAHMTIGQGAKIGGASRKWFVVGKKRDIRSDTVFVCAGTHHPALYVDELDIQSLSFNWIGGVPPPMLLNENHGSMRAWCRIRHLQPLVRCEVRCLGKMLRLRFDKPLRGVTPGQIAALYVADGLVCLGGGPIEHRGPTYKEQGLPLPSDLHPSGINDRPSRQQQHAAVP